MGSDLMIKLGVNLSSPPDGLKVMHSHCFNIAPFDEIQSTSLNVLYVYEWLFPMQPADLLVNLAHTLHLSPDPNNMRPEHLHCTAHVSPYSDDDYGDKFLADVNDKLQLNTLFSER